MTNKYGLGVDHWSPPDDETADEFYAFSEEYPRQVFSDIYSKSSDSVYLDASNRAKYIYERLCSAIDSGSSFSLVRISDGEGNCLFTSSKYPKLKQYILSRISYIHFGDADVVPTAAANFSRYMLEAIATADVVCVPEPASIQKGFLDASRSMDVRAQIGNRQSALSTFVNIKSGQITASAWTNRHLLEYYGKLLSGRDCVGIISSYPALPDLIKSAFSVKQVVYHEIPRQAVFLKSADRVDSGHYPSVFDKISAEIAPRFNGMPYLVSAGLLAKYYCHLVKCRGGVAIDTGSVPEIWQGIPNRGLSNEFIERWRLTT